MDKLKAKFKADGRDPSVITIAPTDIPESAAEEQKPAGWGEFPPKQEITIVPPKKLKSGQTYQDQNKYWQSQGQAPIYKTNEEKEPTTRQELLNRVDKIQRMMTQERNPANLQILRKELEMLKQRYQHLKEEKTRLDKTHINLTESKTYKLWESAGRKIVEAQLTAAQIQQIFQQAEQGATAAGTNRTGLGQVKDASGAVAQAWEQLKTKVANSGPVKNVDAYYDQAAEKLRQATGGDQGVMRYVEKYRTFAKAHPIAQSLIYSALIAAAGISGAGAGGAAALALLKLTDKLLQGEKFSSAAYSGAKTGALAYGASLLKDLMSGTQGVTTSVEDPEWEKLRFQGDLVSVNQVVTTTNGTDTFKEVIQSIVGPNAKGEYLVRIVNNDDLREFVTKTPPPSVATGATESKKYSKSKLTETQIKRVFQVAGHMQDQLNEGMWDNVKNTAKGLANKAAGAVVNKAQTIGTNLTNKVTADKLMTAWKKAGSPLDSEQVKAIMKQSGVADNIITATMPAQTTTAPVQRVAAVNPTQPMPATVAEDQDTSGVERAILNRIMVAHTDLLMKYGTDKVMQAAEEVAYNVGDVDEIGTSDVSAYVQQVKQILGATP
jgi:CRISPR/Cas system CSM-associated protein Csm2 small subunit